MTLRITEIRWRGQDALLLAGERLEAVVMRRGAALAALRVPGEGLNPLWQPPWPAADPVAAASDPAYGGGPGGGNHEAALLAAAVGSFPCLDRFGAPWPGELVPPHGEAPVVMWLVETAGSEDLVLTAALPGAHLRLRRRFAIAGNTLRLDAAVNHNSPLPREVEWCEHATLGDPFLDGCAITAGIDAAWTLAAQAEGRGRFAITAPETPVDPAAALAMPAVSDPPAGDIAAARVATDASGEGWWRASHAGLGRTLEARWKAADFPWLAIWTEHRSRQVAPWRSATRARGLEISTKPFPEGKPPPERATRWQGRPTNCVVAPGAWREHSIRFTWG
jgi:hypothetical protein